MTDDPTYEYRVLCPDHRGSSEWSGCIDSEQEASARSWADEMDAECGCERRPHLVQRRLVTPWEDVPDDQ